MTKNTIVTQNTSNFNSIKGTNKSLNNLSNCKAVARSTTKGNIYFNSLNSEGVNYSRVKINQQERYTWEDEKIKTL